MQTKASLANIGPDSSLRHGVFARPGNLMACDRCPLKSGCDRCEPGARCALEREYVETRTAQIGALPFIGPEDLPAVSILVWLECRIARAQAYLANAGDLLPGHESHYLECQPLTEKLGGVVNSYQRMLTSPGLTPGERRKLTATGEAGPAATLAAAIRERSNERKAPEPVSIDGDFEACDEEVSGDE
jgi:hypothetical protein